MAFDGGNLTSGRPPTFYFASGDVLGPAAIYAVDARTGALRRNTSLSDAGGARLAVSAMAWNPGSLRLEALVFGAGGAAQAVEVDPETGAVRVLAATLPLPAFQGPCEASMAAHARAGSRLYCVMQDKPYSPLVPNTTSFLMCLQLDAGGGAPGNLTALWAWPQAGGLLSNVAACSAPAAAGGAELVLFTTSASDHDGNTTAELVLWALDPAAPGSAAAVAVVRNPQAADGPLLPTYGTLGIDAGDGSGRHTVSLLATNWEGRIYTYLVQLNVTVGATGVTAAGAPSLVLIDDSDTTGGMLYRMDRVVTA